MLAEVCPQLETHPANDLQCPNLPDLKSVIMLSEKEFPGTLKFSDVLESGTNVQLQALYDLQDKLQFDDPINIQFTSGTTGRPKGATLTHHNIINNSRSIGYRLGYDKQESRICIPVPLYHCFGMVIGSLQSVTHGATCVFPCPGFEPAVTLTAVHDERCTSLYGTPTMFIDMLHVPHFSDFDLQSLYTGVMAGSPCPIEVMRQVTDRMHMPNITICYGTTENSPVTFQSHMDDTVERRVSTIGRVHPNTEAKVINDDGEVVPIDTPGNLCIRGYSVMLGYWDDAEKTKESILPDGWYQTGDIAVIDEDGYGRIVGRLTDMIIRGGENVYPVEVENVIYKHPKVADVQVIGIPDERLGEEVCAWIRLNESVDATAEEIKNFCKGKLSHFKVPRHIRFVGEYPMTVTGKVQKYKMRNEEAGKLKSSPARVASD
ncbi:Medium-chain acyl-CoA ligase ACSF2, mitochondrial [Lamellibrachia satsuma]|nr:Medium-chain acyl-CoA ligase ACSF2, mitochondrial [Lamellibrachia satsuma]